MRLRVAKRIHNAKKFSCRGDNCGHKWTTLEKASSKLREGFKRRSRLTHTVKRRSNSNSRYSVFISTLDPFIRVIVCGDED